MVSSAGNLYSFESTLAVLNSCTQKLKDGALVFDSCKYALYENTREEQRRRDAKLAEQQKQPVLLIPRLPLMCHNFGDVLMCD